MTHTTSYTEPELVTYMAQLGTAELEGRTLPIPIEVHPFSALMVIGALQLVTRHPSVDDVVKKPVHDVIDQLSTIFAGTIGEEIIRRGNDPTHDR